MYTFTIIISCTWKTLSDVVSFKFVDNNMGLIPEYFHEASNITYHSLYIFSSFYCLFLTLPSILEGRFILLSGSNLIDGKQFVTQVELSFLF